MSTTFNSQLITEALNKHTKESFRYLDDGETFTSKYTEILEVEMYIFDIYELRYDKDTGGTDSFLIGENETLADTIDLINKLTEGE